MDFYNVPIGFGLALSSNTAAMNYYARLSEDRKQEILSMAHGINNEKEIYRLIASMANGTLNC